MTVSKVNIGGEEEEEEEGEEEEEEEEEEPMLLLLWPLLLLAMSFQSLKSREGVGGGRERERE